MNKKQLRNALMGLAMVGGVGALVSGYALAVRPWHLRWGATDEEIAEILPGDDVKPDAGEQVTHAISINAPASEIWKWLVQIGQGRGGFFSYDCLENLIGLEIHNVGRIVPKLQDLKVGDFIRSAHKGWLGGAFDSKAGWFVVRLEPERSLVLRDEIKHGSWAFVLHPIAKDQTRLVIRIRGDEARNFGRKLLNVSIFEPAHFIMERKMLLTLKHLAEKSYDDEVDDDRAK
jgi:hypothetical protein